MSVSNVKKDSSGKYTFLVEYPNPGRPGALKASKAATKFVNELRRKLRMDLATGKDGAPGWDQKGHLSSEFGAPDGFLAYSWDPNLSDADVLRNVKPKKWAGLRTILANEGLLKSASVIDKATERRLKGGSVAVRKAFMSLMSGMSGQDITVVDPDDRMGPGWSPYAKSIKIKAGLAKLVSASDARSLEKELVTRGWKKRSDDKFSYTLYHPDWPSHMYGGLGFVLTGGGKVSLFNDLSLSRGRDGYYMAARKMAPRE